MKENRIEKIEAGSFYTYLPEGCKICREGAKLVLFLTGECVHSCFYCPISEERKNRDVVFANERPVNSEEDIVAEAEMMDAEGASITGGEPLAKPSRLYEILSLLKKLDFHVHLYTSIPASWKTIEKLNKLGLDEIRFHPVNLENSDKFTDCIKYAKSLGIDAGFEIPALNFRVEIAEISNRLDCFINLNELEFSSTNYESLQMRGYEVDDFYGAIGSERIAKLYAEVTNKFHYCTARFKDGVQLRKRLLRMAFNHPEFYSITEDGTIMCGYIEGENIQKAIEFFDRLGEKYAVVDGGIEVGMDVARKWSEHLKVEKFKVSIIERYPTFKRIIVEIDPI